MILLNLQSLRCLSITPSSITLELTGILASAKLDEASKIDHRGSMERRLSDFGFGAVR